MSTIEGRFLGQGGKLFGSDSDAVSALDVSLLPPGTVAWNAEVEADFALTIDDSALVTDEILAVAGYDELRWVIVPAIPDITVPVPNSDLATMAAHTFKANITAGIAAPTDATLAQVRTELDAGQTVTLSGSGTDITLPGLNGDVDGVYLISFYLIAGASGTGVVTVRPNNLTTNQVAQGGYSYNGTVGALNALSLLQISSGSTTGNNITGQITIHAKTGKPRFFSITCYDPNGGLGVGSWINGQWTDTGTNMTSSVIHCATADGFLTGSTATLVRLV